MEAVAVQTAAIFVTMERQSWGTEVIEANVTGPALGGCIYEGRTFTGNIRHGRVTDRTFSRLVRGLRFVLRSAQMHEQSKSDQNNGRKNGL